MVRSFIGSIINSLSLVTPLLFELDESASFSFCSSTFSRAGKKIRTCLKPAKSTPMGMGMGIGAVMFPLLGFLSWLELASGGVLAWG